MPFWGICDDGCMERMQNAQRRTKNTNNILRARSARNTHTENKACWQCAMYTCALYWSSRKLHIFKKLFHFYKIRNCLHQCSHDDWVSECHGKLWWSKKKKADENEGEPLTLPVWNQTRKTCKCLFAAITRDACICKECCKKFAQTKI